MTFIAARRLFLQHLFCCGYDKCCYLRGLVKNGLSHCIAVSPRWGYETPADDRFGMCAKRVSRCLVCPPSGVCIDRRAAGQFDL
jgi:hypothetical protein